MRIFDALLLALVVSAAHADDAVTERPWDDAWTHRVNAARCSDCVLESGCTMFVRPTSRLLIVLPSDLYPESGLNVRSEGATLGAVSSGEGLVGPPCWSRSLQAELEDPAAAEGRATLVVPSSVPDAPPYVLHVVVRNEQETDVAMCSCMDTAPLPPASLGCEALPPASLPGGARAAETERARLKDCDSEALYYGIGREADFVAARHCAVEEYLAGNSSLHQGAGILLMIYANGRGVSPNFLFAAHVACELGGAPMEVSGRLEHLKELEEHRVRSTRKGTAFVPGPPPLDVCDDVTSGMATGICAAHDERVAEVGRNARRSAAVAKLPAEAADELAAAEAALQAFIDAHDGEVDLSGTARGAFSVMAEAAVRDAHVEALQRLAQRLPPADGGIAAEAADRELNAAYRAALAADQLDRGTVTKDDIRNAERAWLAYRDAWLKLAGAADPGRDAQWLSWITQQRTEQLRALAP